MTFLLIHLESNALGLSPLLWLHAFTLISAASGGECIHLKVYNGFRRLERDYGSQVLCYGLRRRESAMGGLDGRQCQDAAIVGVEGLRVAPGPENRQQ